MKPTTEDTTLQETFADNREWLRQDTRTRQRPKVLQSGKAHRSPLPDLQLQAVPFAATQPAIGTASYLPGCNCPICRIRNNQDDD